MTAPAYDPALAYPPYDTPFLSHWAGRFEAVLVVLHPFYAVPGIDPVADGYVASRFNDSDAGRVAYDEASARSSSGDAVVDELRSDSELIGSIARPSGDSWIDEAQRAPWSEVAQLAGLSRLGDVALALLLSIGALRPTDEAGPENAASVRALMAACERAGLFPPGEGRFQPVLGAAMIDLIDPSKDRGLIHQPEFDNEPRSHFHGEERWLPIGDGGSLYSPDKTRLLTVDWDSHFTLAAGDRTTLEAWRKKWSIDSFFAEPSTGHHWWSDPSRLN